MTMTASRPVTFDVEVLLLNLLMFPLQDIQDYDSTIILGPLSMICVPPTAVYSESGSPFAALECRIHAYRVLARKCVTKTVSDLMIQGQ